MEVYGKTITGLGPEHLSKLQKRAARIILHAEFNNSSDAIFRELGWFSVPNRINFNKAVSTAAFQNFYR